MNFSFYKGKKVLVTGHTGFKGTWLCKILIDNGAIVTGYALEEPTQPNVFSLSSIEKGMDSVIGDIRDLAQRQAQHRAAQRWSGVGAPFGCHAEQQTQLLGRRTAAGNCGQGTN